MATKECKKLDEKKEKTVECLDCGEEKLVLKFNATKKIYTGRRLCRICRKLQKRKYIGNW